MSDFGRSPSPPRTKRCKEERQGQCSARPCPNDAAARRLAAGRMSDGTRTRDRLDHNQGAPGSSGMRFGSANGNRFVRVAFHLLRLRRRMSPRHIPPRKTPWTLAIRSTARCMRRGSQQPQGQALRPPANILGVLISAETRLGLELAAAPAFTRKGESGSDRAHAFADALVLITTCSAPPRRPPQCWRGGRWLANPTPTDSDALSRIVPCRRTSAVWNGVADGECSIWLGHRTYRLPPEGGYDHSVPDVHRGATMTRHGDSELEPRMLAGTPDEPAVGRVPVPSPPPAAGWGRRAASAACSLAREIHSTHLERCSS